MWSLTNNTLATPDGYPLLTHVPPAVTLTPHTPDSPGIFLRVQTQTPAPRWQAPIGNPAIARFAACFRNEPFWMKPAIGANPADIPIETQLLFTQLPDHRIALFVPLIDAITRCSLQGHPPNSTHENTLTLVAETGHPALTSSSASALFIAIEHPATPNIDPLQELCRRAAQALQRHSHPGQSSPQIRALPRHIDSFGWCTWDAFYQDISHDNLLAGLQSFHAAGIPLRTLILDDGWQSEADLGESQGRRLTSFAPNAKFHHDLTPTIRAAKENFGIQHFLVWQTLQGYWGGIDPAHFPQYHPQETARDFSSGLRHYWPDVNTQPWGSHAGIVPPQFAQQFFHDYHHSLAAQGVTGVKVDNQATLESLTAATDPPTSRTALYQQYRAALDASVRRHFHGNLLSCMSCANDNLFVQSDFPLTRTSTDFWPTKPETHGLHLWTNALVSLFFSHFIHPDWDMFQSNLPGNWSAFHAAARAISGGPVYVSDKPGQHNVPLLQKLVLSDGSILRCDAPAAIARDSLFHDPTRDPALLKIRNTNRNRTTGIIGLFNCHYDPANPTQKITATLSPADIPEIAGHPHYAVYLHNAAQPLILAEHETHPISLAQSQCELATIIPIQNGIALIGLTNKFNSAAAITHSQFHDHQLHLHLRDHGPLLLYSKKSPSTIHLNHQIIPHTHNTPWLTIEIPPSVPSHSNTPREIILTIPD